MTKVQGTQYPIYISYVELVEGCNSFSGMEKGIPNQEEKYLSPVNGEVINKNSK